MTSKKTEQEGAKSKKKWIIAAVVVVVLAAAVAGNSDAYKNSKQQTETSAQSTEQDVEQSTETVADTMEPEANTSAKVDALALEAKEAAAEGVTDEQRAEAVTFIVEHYPDYYADNETMEQVMAYGFWLEYAYKDDEARDYAELGMDVSQAVKYVYRGVEAVEDDATQENLRQIKETLEKLGYNVE